jgi:DNA-binding CsgD family transcriptional regulator/PAS domain-containing protein
LLNALYDSLAELPMWAKFLRAAREAFVCDHATLSFSSWQTEQDEPVHFADEVASLEAVEALYRIDLFDDLPPEMSVEVQASVVPEAGAVLRRALVIAVAVDGGRTLHLALWRNAAVGPFDGAAHELLNGMVAPLKRGARLFFRIADLERRQIVFNAAIETTDTGVMLVDPDGGVLFTNDVADAILRAGDGLLLAHGKLRARNAAETALLMEHVRHKAAEQQAAPDWQVYTPIALQRPDNPLPLTVIIRPGPAYHPLRNPLQRTAMLVLRDPGRRPIPAHTLSRLFGLTPAESLLASELGRGASLEEAAAHLGISRNTVRSQLQSVFMKTGTNRQGDLVRMLLSSAAALSR